MKSIFSIFKRGLEKSATKISRSIASVFGNVKLHGKSSFDELERLLIGADFGVAASKKIVSDIRDLYDRGKLDADADLAAAARNTVNEILRQNTRKFELQNNSLTVILFVGVNGSGKTTTIGKLAANLKNDGKKVVLGACDTFRAAAVEQLQLWGERTGCKVVSGKPGADPAGVAFDAVKTALNDGADVLLIDTAGRQHNQKNLMEELAKIRRSLNKALPGAPHETILTVDSSLGANVISQAREFSATAGVTALALTKLDGTGKGGMAVALNCEFDLPTFFIGLGEQPEDLQEFDIDFFLDAMFGEKQ